MDTIPVMMTATEFAAMNYGPRKYRTDEMMERAFIQYIRIVVGLDILETRMSSEQWAEYLLDHEDDFIGEYADFTTFVQEIINVTYDPSILPFDVLDSIDYDEVADKAEEQYATALSEDGVYIWELR